MKKLIYVAPLTTLVASVSVALAAGSASAAAPDASAPAQDPHTVEVQIAPGVQYSGNTVDSSTVLETPFGTVTTQGGAIRVADPQGRTVFGQESFSNPPKAETTTPKTTAPAAGTGTSAAHDADAAQPVTGPAAPVDQQADINSAVGQAATQFGLATGVGGLVGGVAGVVIGCPVGALTAGTLITPVTAGALTPAAAVGGCLLGASAVGGVGTIVGGALLGIPVGVASAVQAYNTLHAQGDV